MNTTLRKLIIDDCITNPSPLFKILSSNTTLTHLVITVNSDDTAMLCEMLRRNNTILDLSLSLDYPIISKEICSIFETLKHNNSIQKLTIGLVKDRWNDDSFIGIDIHSANVLFELLCMKTSLTHFDFTNNPHLNDECASIIAKGLRKNKKIKSIKLPKEITNVGRSYLREI